MEKDKERLQVIENIRKAVENKEFNSKVELHDHIVTDEERERVILKYDSRKKKLRNKAKTIVARSITDSITDYVNIKTEIKGIENIKGMLSFAGPLYKSSLAASMYLLLFLSVISLFP